MCCNLGLSILIGLAMVARHMDTIGISSEKHLEKEKDQERRKKSLTNSHTRAKQKTKNWINKTQKKKKMAKNRKIKK